MTNFLRKMGAILLEFMNDAGYHAELMESGTERKKSVDTRDVSNETSPTGRGGN